jgi:hypothetical protein
VVIISNILPRNSLLVKKFNLGYIHVEEHYSMSRHRQYLSKHPEDKSQSELTEQIQHDICAGLRMGGQIVPAAHYAGVTEWQVFDWMAKAETEGPGDPHFEFRKAVTYAEARTELSMVSRIKKAANDDWRAAAWWLERTKKERYSKTSQVDHVLSGKVEYTMQDIEGMTLEERKSIFSYVQAVNQFVDNQRPQLDQNGDPSTAPLNRCLPPGHKPYAEEDIIDVEVEPADEE